MNTQTATTQTAPVEAKASSVSIYANPYDIEAGGFYFSSVEEFEQKAKGRTNNYGQPVEEYGFEFIDGSLLECALAKAIGSNLCNLVKFFEVVETWSDDEIIKACIMFGEGILHLCEWDDYEASDGDDLELYEDMSFTELAEHFVDEGIYGDIPEHLAYYIDYQAIGRDLSCDGFCKIEVGNYSFIYRSA